ncbi:unnamed protein product [Rangifer tarandus platyrhynchus]|uniref:Major allergen I polypeptide chain 1-like n=1 Tax=Rangifer tarandus platyrhynchus TaxID=3082113 RepID=A0ABN8YL29_RANTA|nr:unnamed protein product [Rangifer tarandus platyrhynchus]
MTRAGALLLLCAALLLIAGGKCDDICQALRDSINLFILGSHDTYIEQVEKYNKTSDVLETADTLKSCADKSLTAKDKQDALSALVGQAICECACGVCVGVRVSGACSEHWEVGGSYPLHPGPSPGTWVQKDPHE